MYPVVVVRFILIYPSETLIMFCRFGFATSLPAVFKPEIWMCREIHCYPRSFPGKYLLQWECVHTSPSPSWHSFPKKLTKSSSFTHLYLMTCKCHILTSSYYVNSHNIWWLRRVHRSCRHLLLLAKLFVKCQYHLFPNNILFVFQSNTSNNRSVNTLSPWNFALNLHFCLRLRFTNTGRLPSQLEKKNWAIFQNFRAMSARDVVCKQGKFAATSSFCPNFK